MDSVRLSRVGRIRNSQDFKSSLPVHKAYGDICLAYQLHLRDELVNIKKERDELREKVNRQRETFEREKEEIEQRVAKEICQRDQLITQLETERKELKKRVEAMEQLSEERKIKLEELKRENDTLQQCM